jgi:carbonic anhydrase
MKYAILFENNKAWAEKLARENPSFFEKLAREHRPEILYIGCSDSRVPANEIMDVAPGEVFVHRNIGNLICNTDLNAMSVIEYAVSHLGVKHILVCGHYNCGGVKAAMQPRDLGLLNPWLRNVRDVYRLHQAELDAIGDEALRYDRLVELNVVEQCLNVVKIACVQQSYLARRYPVVHGVVFNLRTGLMKDLNLDFKEMLRNIQQIYRLTESKWT